MPNTPLPSGFRGVVVVEGLADLTRAFKVANAEVAKDVRTAIEQAGEPIRADAQNRVRGQISGMARSRKPWWEIRAGVEKNSIGYIVPRQRGVNTIGRERFRRRNLAPLIATREQAALDNNRHRVLGEFRQALAEVARAWGRV